MRNGHLVYYACLVGALLLPMTGSGGGLDLASMKWIVTIVGTESTVGEAVYQEEIQSFSQRFGVYPNFIVFEDTDDPVDIVFGVRGQTWLSTKARKSWVSGLTWADIKSMFSVKLQTIDSSAVTIMSLDQAGIMDTLSIQEYKIQGRLHGNLRDFKIPADGKARTVELIVHPTGVPDSIEASSEGSITVVATTRATLFDSLEWFDRHAQSQDIDVARGILRAHPDIMYLYRHVFDAFIDQAECDSARHWGVQWNDAVVRDKFPFQLSERYKTMISDGPLVMGIVDDNGNEHSIESTLDYIHFNLQASCGDSTLYK